MPDYSDPTKFKVHGGGVPQYFPVGYPKAISQDPLISNYVLALNPQWNTVLNPDLNLRREGARIYNNIRAMGNSAQLRNLAQEYFKTNPMPYSNPEDPSIDYSLAVQQAQEYARSMGRTYEFPSKERAKKSDSVFSSFEPNVSITDIIPNIPEVQAATAVRVPDSVSISVSPSENTVLINLTPHGDGGSPILSYHIVLRNQTTGQEIQLTLHQTTRTLIQNLDSGTNYTVYAIAVNAVGNSPENSISFKTDDSTIAIPTPEPIPEPIPSIEEIPIVVPDVTPTIDKSINSMMVSQSIGAFILKDGRVKGEILYIANQSFNPYYYDKNLTSLVQIKSKTGIGIAIKPNNLNFTQTQRDERIQIDEAVGNFKELLIDFFVWDTPLSMQIFSETKQIQVVEELPPSENGDKFKPCQIGYHKDFSGKCVPDDPLPEIPRDKLMDTLKGFLFGTIALSLLARKY